MEKVFRGEFRWKTTCHTCASVSAVTEPFYDLSLQIPLPPTPPPSVASMSHSRCALPPSSPLAFLQGRDLNNETTLPGLAACKGPLCPKPHRQPQKKMWRDRVPALKLTLPPVPMQAGGDRWCARG